jgi:hypothetical protein
MQETRSKKTVTVTTMKILDGVVKMITIGQQKILQTSGVEQESASMPTLNTSCSWVRLKSPD